MSAETDGKPLEGRVAVVAGSTRGAGRGIARGLGEAGATVYCTGRSTAAERSEYDRPETIEQTAELVTAAGGEGVPVRVDHTREDEVAALFARVDSERGRLDVLVDSVAGETPALGTWGSFWETDLERGLEALEHALFSHVITAKHAAPLMIRAKRGLVAQVTEGELLYSSGNIVCQLVKFGLKGLAMMLAAELEPHSVASVSVSPGFLRSESMLEHFGVTEDNWRDGGKKDPTFLHSETPLFLGRGVAALAGDDDVLALSGGLLSSWGLARRYGVTDADGSRPDLGRHFTDELMSKHDWLRRGTEWHATWLEGIAGRARSYLGAAV